MNIISQYCPGSRAPTPAGRWMACHLVAGCLSRSHNVNRIELGKHRCVLTSVVLAWCWKCHSSACSVEHAGPLPKDTSCCFGHQLLLMYVCVCITCVLLSVLAAAATVGYTQPKLSSPVNTRPGTTQGA